MDPQDASSVIEAFTSQRRLLKKFKFRLHSLVDGLIYDRGLRIVTIESRVKEINSFTEKINQPDKNYSDPLNEITDLVGLRVITYQGSDVDAVIEIIEQNFNVDRQNTIDKSAALALDQFGYRSVHYVVSLSQQRAALPEYSGMANIRAEIQIRTVLQHAWAAFDHKLRYKSESEIPPKHARHLFRVSALLETADNSFEALTLALAENRTNYTASIAEGDLSIPLDLDSLTIYLDQGKLPQELSARAVAAGLVINPNHPSSKLKTYSRLLSFAQRALKADELKELDSLIASAEPSISSFFETFEREWRAGIEDPNVKLVLTKERLFLLIFKFAASSEITRKSLLDPVAMTADLGKLEKAFLDAVAKFALQEGPVLGSASTSGEVDN